MVKLQANADLYRKLPSVDELQRSPELAALASKEGQAAVTDAARNVLASLRQEIAAGRLDANGHAHELARVRKLLAESSAAHLKEFSAAWPEI